MQYYPAGSGQRAFFEEFTREKQQLLEEEQQHSLPGHQFGAAGAAASIDTLALPQPDGQQQQQQEHAQDGPAGTDADPHSGGSGSDSGGERVFNIHEVAGVSPLFGSS